MKNIGSGTHMKGRFGPKCNSWKGGRYQIPKGYTFLLKPDHPRSDSRGYIREHILIAEKALGKSLPEKAQVHHHTWQQLVICQDNAYHKLLHQRQRALEACGHANWRKCCRCGQYDNPKNLTIPKSPRQSAYHKSCANEYQKRRKVSNGGI